MQLFDFSSCHVLVVGDLILDRYVDGTVGRISPEAPIPVVVRKGERTILGGAANVAANIASLGARVTLIGLLGDDQDGAAFLDLLSAHPGIDAAHVLRDATRPTTCKTRVVSGSHQLIRLDTESVQALGPELEEKVVGAVAERAAEAHAIVLSDYAKGFCSDGVVRAVVETAASLGKPALVDPKRRDFSIYRGATLIKPNRQELREATGLPCGSDDEATRAAGIVMDRTGSSVLLTRSEQGLSFFRPGATPLHARAAARDVFDVSGAGDTVMAAVALGVATGLSSAEFMRVANAAAGIVVGKAGTAVVTLDELERALRAESHTGSGEGLTGVAEAVRRRDEWAQRGLTVGFTNGCFDLLHPGHVSLLQRAAAECDRLIVAINTDESVARLKGPTRPVQPVDARACMLLAMKGVDMVVSFGEDTPAELIGQLQPDLLVKGGDYTVENVVGADVVRRRGGRVLLAGFVDGHSTTSMVGRMKRAGSNDTAERPA